MNQVIYLIGGSGISKAKFQLGWEPKMDISETVALTIDWYKRYTVRMYMSYVLNK